jgi:hypothetical protein
LAHALGFFRCVSINRSLTSLSESLEQRVTALNLLLRVLNPTNRNSVFLKPHSMFLELRLYVLCSCRQ